MATTITDVLITGANAGLGLECARQLALKPDMKRIILGCRNAERAQTAKNLLEKKTGKKIFEVLIIDLLDPASVKQAVDELQGEIDALVLNAGGKGGKDHASISNFGVPLIVAANVAGHVLLVDLLLKEEKLKSASTVIYSGSEGARGLPSFGIPKPDIKDGSVEEFSSFCDGSFYVTDKSFDAMYSRTKLVGALWMGDMARKHPDICFVTMSPGGTAGTNVLSNFPKPMQLMRFVLLVLKFFGIVHGVEAGAKRYVDALFDENTYRSGIFYASKNGAVGEVVDQVVFMPELNSEAWQMNANTAIHKFVQV